MHHLCTMKILILRYTIAMSENTKVYWFKRRRYGYGWTPSSWQGWMVVVVFLGAILFASWRLSLYGEEPSTWQLVLYFTAVGLGAIVLVASSYLKGPSPKWRWGSKPEDNPDEDY